MSRFPIPVRETYHELTGRNEARDDLELALIEAEMTAAQRETEAAVAAWEAEADLDAQKLRELQEKQDVISQRTQLI